MGHPVRWAHGFQLGGPIGLARPTGSRADPRTFGHNGSSICNVWADPVRDIVVAYLTNTADERRRALRHLSDVSDAVLVACD
jgi:CubicO group peptidase (beta-lactamase class C family)